ncbi:MAG: hypothetical protein BMS9Abin05_1450 [Rhodothermia bacterium]|nr:MAG: hypothetical protein BMS9Abin05_1450 [Rhodothermia bacterium]
MVGNARFSPLIELKTDSGILRYLGLSIQQCLLPVSRESAKSPVEETELFGAHFLYATESSRSGVLSRRHE